MLATYAGYWALGRLRNRENPVTVARNYKMSRGMALKPDLVDWLGGYPFEFASADEIVAFLNTPELSADQAALLALTFLGAEDATNIG